MNNYQRKQRIRAEKARVVLPDFEGKALALVRDRLSVLPLRQRTRTHRAAVAEAQRWGWNLRDPAMAERAIRAVGARAADRLRLRLERKAERLPLSAIQEAFVNTGVAALDKRYKVAVDPAKPGDDQQGVTVVLAGDAIEPPSPPPPPEAPPKAE